MKINKILVSQPKPSSEKSPYYDLEKKYGVEVAFHPFIKVEGLTSKEFRQQKIAPGDFTAVIFTARTAIDHYFRLCKELRYEVPETMKYFCISEMVALYLQKYTVYRKRKIFYSSTGKGEDLIPLIEKHKKEKFLYPVSDVHDSKLNLEAHGLPSTRAIMYRTVSNKWPEGQPFDVQVAAFFTPSGIKSLLENFPEFDQKKDGVLIAAMGPKTLDEAKKQGLNVDITTSKDYPSMVGALDHFLAENQKAEEKAERSRKKTEKAEETKKATAKKPTAKKASAKKAAE